jgi:ribosomal protein L9
MNTVLKSAMQRQQLHNVVLLHRLINVRHGHTVRIIAIKDMGPKFYTNDVVTVKAGYARNYLIPQKIAVYATRENFKKRNLVDPQLETAEEKKLRLLRESENVEDQNKKEADRLRKYLLNKSVRQQEQM